MKFTKEEGLNWLEELCVCMGIAMAEGTKFTNLPQLVDKIGGEIIK